MKVFLGASDENFLESHRNGLCPLGKIEEQYDSGKIVFMPINANTPAEWQCVIVDPTLRHQTWRDLQIDPIVISKTHYEHNSVLRVP